MFDKLIKYLKFLNHTKQEQTSPKEHVIHRRIEPNLTYLKDVLGKSDDILFREFKIGAKKQTKAFICYVDGLVDKDFISEFLIQPLLAAEPIQQYNKDEIQSILDAAEVKMVIPFNETITSVLSGNTALFIDGFDRAVIIGSKGYSTRGVEEPNTEVSVRGPREGFNENLRTNTTLLRRKIKNPNLIVEQFRLGQQTQTDVCIVYLKGIANPKIVEEIRNRLKEIIVDSILESGYLEQFIEDHPLSPFATIGNTEKPDKAVAKILEGRVAILCDGTPFVLTVPYLFIESIQVSEDYYSRPYLSSFLRLLRIFAFIVSLTTPALYVALETTHQEMIPTILLITAAAAREGIPFPSFVEAVILGMMFELLRESGIRLPRQVGQAVSIVGALIIGEAAVMAGILSAPMVIIGALTAITSFMVPAILDAVFFFRVFLLLLSAGFGLYGIIIGLIIMLAHMCSLRSFGTPYFAPLGPTIWSGLKDSIIRAPLWLMESRPKSITWQSSKKQASKLKPEPPKNNG